MTRLETASLPWIDPGGRPRLTVMAKGIWDLGMGAIHYIGPERIEAAELNEAARSADPRARLQSDDPQARATLEPGGRLVVHEARGGAHTTRSFLVPLTLEAQLVARSGARLALPISLHAVRLHPGAKCMSLTWHGLAGVRAEELREIVVALPVSEPEEPSGDETLPIVEPRTVAPRVAPFPLASPGGSGQTGLDPRSWQARGEGFPAELANTDCDETVVPIPRQLLAMAAKAADDETNRTTALRVADVWREADAPFPLPGPAKADVAPAQGLPPWRDAALVAPVIRPGGSDETLLPFEGLGLAAYVAQEPAAAPPASPLPIVAGVPASSAPAIATAPASPPASTAAPEPATGLRAVVLERLRGRASLRELNLAGADLAGIDFGGAQLSGVDLRNAKLQGAVFSDVRLTDAQLGGADLTEALFLGADLSRADLSRACVSRARFDDALLEGATFSGANGAGASFVGARGSRAIFAGGAWEGAAFSQLEGNDADFSDSGLGGADFRAAKLGGASFERAHGANVSFDDAELQRARGLGARLTTSSFTKIDGAGSIWDQAVLDGSRFAGANLKGASFQRATCGKASFVNANLRCANLQRLVGDGVDFTGAALEASDLRQARLHDASFEDANVRSVLASPADLSRSRFGGADLSSANMRNAKLPDTNFARARLDAADLRGADLERARLPRSAQATAKLAGARTAGLIDDEPEATTGSSKS